MKKFLTLSLVLLFSIITQAAWYNLNKKNAWSENTVKIISIKKKPKYDDIYEYWKDPVVLEENNEFYLWVAQNYGNNGPVRAKYESQHKRDYTIINPITYIQFDGKYKSKIYIEEISGCSTRYNKDTGNFDGKDIIAYKIKLTPKLIQKMKAAKYLEIQMGSIADKRTKLKKIDLMGFTKAFNKFI